MKADPGAYLTELTRLLVHLDAQAGRREGRPRLIARRYRHPRSRPEDSISRSSRYAGAALSAMPSAVTAAEASAVKSSAADKAAAADKAVAAQQEGVAAVGVELNPAG